MRRIGVVAARELRGYFESWLASVFIGCFVAASMVAFFMIGRFFGAGRTEVTAFFESLPWTLLFLVPGLTMRQWAREAEMGSIELLMTLPARTGELVAGKFVGCLGLVAVALAFTIGIPVTAESLGDLDWGPVAGGYVAALLLGAAYVAIGLFVSSWFADQFLALVCGVLVCGVFAFMSHPTVLAWTDGLPDAVGDALRLFGFWSRFESIQRGVFDLRDVLYYVTVAGLFLYLNVVRLKLRRLS